MEEPAQQGLKLIDDVNLQFVSSQQVNKLQHENSETVVFIFGNSAVTILLPPALNWQMLFYYSLTHNDIRFWFATLLDIVSSLAPWKHHARQCTLLSKRQIISFVKWIGTSAVRANFIVRIMESGLVLLFHVHHGASVCRPLECSPCRTDTSASCENSVLTKTFLLGTPRFTVSSCTPKWPWRASL